MRKRTVRNGMRLVLAALMLIVVTSFYLGSLSDVVSLSCEVENHMYQFGIFLAAALGAYGVVLTVFGLVMPGLQSDSHVRVMPTFLLIFSAVSLFFYLLASSFDAPREPPRDRLRPGETLSI